MFCMVRNFLVLVYIRLISFSFQLMMLKLYVTTGVAKVLMAVIQLDAFSSLFSTMRILLYYSFRIFSFMLEWCKPSPSFTPKYLYVPSWSSSLMTVLTTSSRSVVFVNFPRLKVALAHLSKLHFDIITESLDSGQ